jgi:hypothetical protein
MTAVAAARPRLQAPPASALLYGGLALLYALVRVGSFSNLPDRLTDTPTYERVARLPVWSWRFYAGQRGFTIPLYFKIVPSAEGRIVVQLAFSIVCWLALAGVVARVLERPWLKPVGYAVVLAFSLTTEIVLWDALELSESITFSLTALLLAAWLLLVRSPRPRWVAAVLVLSTLWAFARDTNAYVLAVVGVMALGSLATRPHRRLKTALAVGCIAIFLLDYASADAGKRWLQPMIDVVDHRVLTTPSLERWFVARGLDPSSNWPAGSWVRDHARSTYAGYLLAHPGYALAQPFHGRQQALFSSGDNLESLVDPELSIYNDNAGHRFLPLPARLERLFFPRGAALVLSLVVAIVAGAAAVAWRRGPSPSWLVPLGVLATTYPHFLVVWHQSGLEVDRHALEAALLLRLGAALLALLALDRLLARRRHA